MTHSWSTKKCCWQQPLLRRSTSAGNTTMTVYAFGLEEHLYTGSGVRQGSNTYYYLLGGMLIGESDGTTTNMFLTDALGSVIETISATANSATVQGNQVYSPYGSSRYQQGQMGTAKGFTGQYNDSVSRLDYYNARYYDPVVGQFLSIDKVSGNMQGVDPYAYVGDNPETRNDPTGQRFISPSGQLGPQNSIVSPQSLTTILLSNMNSAVNSATPSVSISFTPPPQGLQALSSTCGYPSQTACGVYSVLYALYGPDGTEFASPGIFCFPGLECNSGGGGKKGEGSQKTIDDYFSASDDVTNESQTKEGMASGGEPPNGWIKLDYGPDNIKGVSDFTHIDEAGNKLEATLYHDSGELHIAWMDSLKQAKNHLPSLIDWLGDSVQTVKGYITDDLATRFSPESRGVTLVNRMFSSVLEKSGFAPGTLEPEGSRIWMIFRRLME